MFWNRLAVRPRPTAAARSLLFFPLLLLVIEFADELVFGVREAAWPLIRSDLNLSYGQVGLLLGVPYIVGSLIELPLGVLGDVWSRRALVVGGGFVFAASLGLFALASSFPVLLLALVLFFPASGAFVSLSQATLMDLEPARHEQNMARWTLAGSLGVVAGPLVLGAALTLGGGWRSVMAVLGGLALVLALVTARQVFPASVADEEAYGLRAGLRGALRALRQRAVQRWLVLLAFSDFMLDVLLGFLALYFVDVVGTSPALAGSAVAVWSGVGLLGDVLLLPLLERVRGVVYLRYSAAATLALYVAFLLVPSLPAKFGLLAALGLANAGWYAILKAQLYSTLPGQSGTVMTISTLFGILEGVVPMLLGLVAARAGLGAMMWLLLLGPVALLVGLRGLKGSQGELEGSLPTG